MPNLYHVFVEVCSIYFFSTDKSSQSLEMPLEDIDPVNQPQMHGGSTKVDSYIP